MQLAVVAGISEYDHQTQLPACANDAKLMSDVLSATDQYSDILFLPSRTSAKDAKTRISSFVETHSKSHIDEILFYFSGHGHRTQDDFFYAFSDFRSDKPETSGFRNSELDGLIRNLSPSLTVKIVDACYSGGVYIKGESDVKPILKKSAQENELQNIYFMYSSHSSETSLAFHNYSLFSLEFFKSLMSNKGRIRYRDIMAYLADEVKKYDEHTPLFITQAKNTEFFGEITEEIIQKIESEISDALDNEGKGVSSQGSSGLTQETLLEKVISASNNLYCSEKEAQTNIGLLSEYLSPENWDKEITNLFEIKIEKEERQLHKDARIGNWIIKNGNQSVFAEPSYSKQPYETQEYVELPPKPARGKASIASVWATKFLNEPDYKLETVTKTRSILNGYVVTAERPFDEIAIQFTPKYSALSHYHISLSLLFSRKDLIIFRSIEELYYTSWGKTSRPKRKELEINRLTLKNKEEIKKYCTECIDQCQKYILDDIQKKISSN